MTSSITGSYDELIDRIYDAAFDPEMWPDVLTDIARSVGGVGGIILPISGSEDMSLLCSPCLTDSVADYAKGWWQYDTRSRAGLARGVHCGVVTDADLVDDETMRRDPFYQDFLKPHGYGRFAAFLSTPVPGQVISMSIQRDISSAAIDAAEMKTLARLGHHAARAMSFAVKLDERRQLSRSVTETIEHLGCGVIVLDKRKHVIYLTQTARRIIRDALCVKNDELICRSASAQQKLDGLFESVTTRDFRLSAPSIVLSGTTGQPTLLVQAIPAKPPRFVVPGTRSDARVLLLLHDLLSAPRSVEDRLMECGLTRGQARVADVVGRGLAPRQAAHELRLTESTIRTVLKIVYDKLGIRRQSELTMLVCRLAGTS